MPAYESDLERYQAEQNAPRRSAVFDITFDRLVRESGLKLTDIMTNEKLYNRILEQAQEGDDRNVFGHDAKKDRNGRWIEKFIPLNLNHFAALRKAEGGRSLLDGYCKILA